MKKYCLIDICDFQGGSQPPKEEWKSELENGYIRMLQIRDFTQSYGKKEYIKLTNSTKTCKSDDILIARYGASVGKILTGLEGAYNVAIMKTIPNENILLKKYLYYYLKSNIFQNYIKNVGSRAAQAGFNKEELKQLYINVPSKELQNEIIKKLSKLEYIIDLRKKQITNLEQLVKSQFVEMFGDINCNDKKLNIKKLKECCLKITDGTHDTPKKYETGKMLITGKNIRENKFDLTNIEYVSEEDHKKIYARCNPEKGDVLYTNIGVNYCTAMVNSLDFEFSMKNVALLKPNYNCIESIYLSYALNILREKITGINKCAGAQTFIGLSSISEIDVPVPKLELQNQFAEFVKLIDKQKFEIEKSLKEMEELYDSLMEEYFG